MEYISRADEILLVAVLRLGEEATGVTIIKKVRKTMGKKLSLGGLWVSLDILAKKGLVTKRLGDPTPRRGGKEETLLSPNRRGPGGARKGPGAQPGSVEGNPRTRQRRLLR